MIFVRLCALKKKSWIINWLPTGCARELAREIMTVAPLPFRVSGCKGARPPQLLSEAKQSQSYAATSPPTDRQRKQKKRPTARLLPAAYYPRLSAFFKKMK